MTTVNKAFEMMLQELKLTDSGQSEASRQQNVLRENLRKGLTLDRDFLSGSYARNTAIRPLNDIDCFLVLNEEDHGHLKNQAPEEALKLVQAVLDKAYPNKELPIIQNRSVNIEFSGTGIGFDVVPSFAKGSNYQIPDRGSNRWVDTNPETHKSVSTEANEKANNKLKPLVKAAKHWNRRVGKPVKSFHLEVMAYEILNGFSSSYPEGLHLMFTKMADRVLDKCPEPAGLGPAIDETMTTSERQAARAKFQDAAGVVAQALELAADGKTEEAHYLWRQLLGEVYPEKGKQPSAAPKPVIAGAAIKSSVDASNVRFG